jgi:hypothetical protein
MKKSKKKVINCNSFYRELNRSPKYHHSIAQPIKLISWATILSTLLVWVRKKRYLSRRVSQGNATFFPA